MKYRVIFAFGMVLTTLIILVVWGLHGSHSAGNVSFMERKTVEMGGGQSPKTVDDVVAASFDPSSSLLPSRETSWKACLQAVGVQSTEELLTRSVEMKSRTVKLQQSHQDAADVLVFFETLMPSDSQKIQNPQTKLWFFFQNLQVVVEAPECPATFRSDFVQLLDSVYSAGEKWPEQLGLRSYMVLASLVGEKAGIGILSPETTEHLRLHPEPPGWYQNSYRKHLLEMNPRANQ